MHVPRFGQGCSATDEAGQIQLTPLGQLYAAAGERDRAPIS